MISAILSLVVPRAQRRHQRRRAFARPLAKRVLVSFAAALALGSCLISPDKNYPVGPTPGDGGKAGEGGVSSESGGAPSGEAGEGLGGESMTTPRAGAGGNACAAGGGATAGVGAGAGAGGSVPESTWRCNEEEGLCQCYIDPSVHPDGWLDKKECSRAERCTERDEVACVCWATEQQYQGALTVQGTKMVERCPP